MRQCKTIFERLHISPNECLQSYIEENDVVDSPTESGEHEKEDDSIDADDIGEDADVDLGNATTRMASRTREMVTIIIFMTLTLVVMMMMAKMS
jgi:hypothetical protein